MTWKLATGIALAALAIVSLGAFLVHQAGHHPSVTVTLRVTVNPREQVGFVAAEAKSAQFKYLMGKWAGVKPVLAQKLMVTALTNSAQVEARIEMPTRGEGQRYVEGFLETLQSLCRDQAQLTLTEQSVR
jgi:hypothetical protein